MPRLIVILALLSALTSNAASQSIPRQLLSAPTHLELDKPTRQLSAGLAATFTVTLKDSRDRTVSASKDLHLVVETPEGKQDVILHAGQFSTSFSLKVSSPGVTQMTVRSGTLRPATGLVLVAPPAVRKLLEMKTLSAGREGAAMKAVPQRKKEPKLSTSMRAHAGAMEEKTSRAPASVPPQAAAAVGALPTPPPQEASLGQATKLKLYINPLPVYGSAIDHVWRASVSVAALNDHDSLAPVNTDVNVHFNATSGSISPADTVIPAGQFSDFQNPAILTDNRAGRGAVDVVSTLGPAGPIEVEYLQPPPTQLRIALGDPVLSDTGSSSVAAQICLLDASGAVTSSGEDVRLSLTPSTGQLQTSSPTIPHDSFCTEPIEWKSAPGLASLLAESGGLDPDKRSITFPAFPWYLVWLAALGGLAGAIVRSSGKYFSAEWWSHTWRSIVIGAFLGFIVFVFARYGALVLPKDFPVKLQNLPKTSGMASFAIGFVGGVLGRGFWGLGKDDSNSSATSKAGKAQNPPGGKS